MAETWLGKEMLRQVELRLAAQAAALAALESRAAGMLNLCGAGVLALGAAAFTAKSTELATAAVVTAALLLMAGTALLWALMPAKNWGVSGIAPKHMTDYGDCDEGECLAAMAESLDNSIAPNSARLQRFNWLIKGAALLILLAAPVGAAVAVYLKPISSVASA